MQSAPPNPLHLSPILLRGVPVQRIPLDSVLTIGRTLETEITLADPSISRRHAAVERSAAGFSVRDLGSSAGSLLNGRLFEQAELVYGDLLQIGPYSLRFDGSALIPAGQSKGGRVQAVGVVRQIGSKVLLNQVSVDIEPGRFVAILGTSGAGKSTLLNTLSGLIPPDGGQVLVNGIDIYQYASAVTCGYVPQDDIVHGELAVRDALRFSAALRVPGSIPTQEIDKLVMQTMEQLRLVERAGVTVSSLSGGQRKRVSIGAELLARPPVLFLDEPSSGLDPATEFKLMEVLRQLANTGCTVICTTHVMENVFLTDEVLVMSRGRLVFAGAPRDVLGFFEIPRFSALYDRMDERPAEEWQAKFVPLQAPPAPPSVPEPVAKSTSRKDKPGYFRILLKRQWALLNSSKRNFITLAGQPLLVGLLVAWMADDKPDLKLFLAWLSTFWFGCGNAAEDIIGELAVYRRERIIGLGRHDYLLMKFFFFGTITFLQSLIFYGIVSMGEMAGFVGWQLLSLFGTALCSVAIGFAISSLVKSKTQAVRLVPLILLPQIVFSGFVLSLPTGSKAAMAAGIPSFSSQRLMDVSLLAGRNLEELSDKLAMGLMKPDQTPPPEAIAYRNIGRAAYERGSRYYREEKPVMFAFGKLMLWSCAGYLTAYLSLRRRERG